MKFLTHLWLPCLLLLVVASSPATAAETRRACVFDPVGADGFVYDLFRDYAVQAREWGYDLETRAYTDESVAANDLKAGKCDMAVLSGVRTRQFVKFAGSLDMAGGLQSYAELRKAVGVMSGPKAAPLMRADSYEVAGIVPLGKVFLFARDRAHLASLDQMAGKRIAVLDYDRPSRLITEEAGASPVPASIASLGPLFNNGSAQLTYAPAIAYAPLELQQGVTPDGGVADFVLAMLSGQIVIHHERFEDDFGAQSRAWVFDQLFDTTLARAEKAEDALDDDLWVAVDAEQKRDYHAMFRRVRAQLWDEEWYSHRMQRLLKKIRCDGDAGLAECGQASEGGAIY
ncbi:RND type efflux pump involved in aminoglycoside resistance [Salinisphaera dokdonensis CL-ES53]|uniref:RND type efflux pump involved in aminoglycoside resistance n=1 Tax=Salinisphaera dokdonensis CL-ES53 TaxID=1304272 RepID=A0ABV2B261_9GAMM